MAIVSTNDAGAVTVKPTERLDSTNAGEFEDALNALLADNPSSLTIDFADVDYISSKGVRVLVMAYKKLDSKKITLVSPNASIVEVLRLSGLLDLFILK